ncbi:MAG TPA: hypothetical protein EYQ61_04700 [Dehalococcoidia bacterium]|jgi:phage FluMu protein Com|nr:hypothetical protein [Dehalococcoidia bacterium]
MTHDTFDATCLRHPEVASNLRCGRCDDLICPQCMVQSPVGARCPDCASIGQAPIFRSTPVELTTTIALSALGAAGFGFAYAIIVWIFWTFLPFNFQIGNVATSLLVGLAGAPIGEYVRKAGKYKLDKRLRIVAAITVFVAWFIGINIASFMGVPGGLFTNIIALIGLGIGVYVAMNRVRP